MPVLADPPARESQLNRPAYIGSGVLGNRPPKLAHRQRAVGNETLIRARSPPGWPQEDSCYSSGEEPAVVLRCQSGMTPYQCQTGMAPYNLRNGTGPSRRSEGVITEVAAPRPLSTHSQPHVIRCAVRPKPRLRPQAAIQRADCPVPFESVLERLARAESSHANDHHRSIPPADCHDPLRARKLLLCAVESPRPQQPALFRIY